MTQQDEYEETPDYYEILGLESDATFDEIKKAYRSLAKVFHPDVSTHPNAKKRFHMISVAYEVLSDDDKREEYDSEREEKIAEFARYREKINDRDEYSRMADYEYYADEPEEYLINGRKRVFDNPRHIIIDDTDYLVDEEEDMLFNTGAVHRFINEGDETYRIDGVEYTLHNAEHYYQSGAEYVIIEGKPFLIRSI